MSATAFDCILGFIHDPKHVALVKGCGRDGAKLISKLKAIGGSKRQQMQTLDGKLADLQLVMLSSCPAFRDEMVIQEQAARIEDDGTSWTYG